MATATRPGSGFARKTGPSAFASASTASVSPPTAAASSSVRPCDVALEPRRVRLDDAVAVHEQADGGPLAVAARVSEDLVHGCTVEERPAPASKPSYVILVSQVGAVPAFGNALAGRRLPFT